MAASDEIILGNKGGLRLLSDRLVDKEGAEYFIGNMKSVSMQQGDSLRADGLLIEFRNGESKVFYITCTSTPLRERMKRGMIASFTMGGRGVMMAANRDLQTQIAEWADKINALIAAQPQGK